jgi:purine-binding chemotaxis protein CheW
MDKSFVTIKIAEYLFGIDISHVREVNRYIDVTPVALAPEMVTGLMNLRGQIVTIIDPGVKLQLNKRTVTKSSRCVVMKTIAEGSSLGLKDITGILVDTIGDIVTVDENSIEPSPPNVGDIDGHLIAGIVKLEQELLIVLKMDELLNKVN